MHKDSLLCVERQMNGWFVRNGSKYRGTRKNIHLSTKTSTIQIPVNGYKEIRDQINTVIIIMHIFIHKDKGTL